MNGPAYFALGALAADRTSLADCRISAVLKILFGVCPMVQFKHMALRAHVHIPLRVIVKLID